MTVQEVIDNLEKVEDKTMKVYIDCFHCGTGMEFAELAIVVIAKTKVPK